MSVDPAHPNQKSLLGEIEANTAYPHQIVTTSSRPAESFSLKQPPLFLCRGIRKRISKRLAIRSATVTSTFDILQFLVERFTPKRIKKMPLEKSERQIIAKKEPLDETIRERAQKFLETGTKDEAWQKQVNAFLSAFFWRHEVSRYIRDSNKTSTVHGELTKALTAFNPFKVDYLASFLETCQNFREGDDELVWEAVKDLIDKRRRSMPRGMEKYSPVRASTKHFTDKANREELEASLIQELKDCVFKDVKGFIERYFGTISAKHPAVKALLRRHYKNGKWIDFPKRTDENSVYKWLDDILTECSPNAPNKLGRNSTAHELESKVQIDMFFYRPTPGSTEFSESNITVVGEHKSTHQKDKLKSVLSQLARYARVVFSAQPTRMFLPAFTFRGSTIEFWNFDRCGAFRSEEVDIHGNPELFARAIIGYATLSSEQLGAFSFFEKEKGGRKGKSRRAMQQKIKLESDNSSKPITVEIGPLLFSQSAIATRGTTCFSANQGVLKLSWISQDRESELAILQEAQKRGVVGVPKLIAHKELVKVSDLREGLDFATARKVKFRAIDAADGTRTPGSTSYTNTSASTSKRGSQELSGSVSDSPAAKRRHIRHTRSASNHSRHTRSASNHSRHTRSASNYSRHTRSASNYSAESQRDSIDEQRPREKSRWNLERLYDHASHGASISDRDDPVSGASSKGKQAQEVVKVQEAPVADTLASPYTSRTLFAILTQPRGKVITEYKTLTELVAALQGATRAHRSLYENGILHRDISVNNIIITPAKKNKGFGGMLIDLDMAKDLRSTTASPRSDRTGTMEFMAWEIVNQEGERAVHSYYHDLQSFLWVLIWLCSQTAWKKPQFRGNEQQPSTNPCAVWWRSAREASDSKMIALKVMNSRFDQLLDRFPKTMERLKDLCWQLRMVLEIIPDITASEAYDRIDAAYTDTLDKLKNE